MPNVVLTGWTPGLRKVSLTKLLQNRAGLPLAAAKDSVDRCLAGERVPIEMPTWADAETLAAEASDLGAVAELTRV